ELWETVQSRAFPGSTSNHHLGTQLALLMAAYEMNQFKDAYQSAVVANAQAFAKSLAAAGLDVQGDPAKGYTKTHQVIVSVGYGEGPEVAERLEQNNIICNYQATPEEEGFTASGALRLGVSEMTRFGFTADDFAKLADLMAACIKDGTDVSEEVRKLRAQHLEMQYCFKDADMAGVMDTFAKKTGL
nr:glycine cleavage system protein T [Clostridiales bacterium]